VRHGLARLNRGPRAAWAALKAVSGISGEVGVYEVGFMLAPRLNAAGRMETAEPSLEILLTDDLLAAGDLAGRLNDANDERKAAEAAILEEARREIDAGFDTAGSFGLAVGREGWHTGTVGIVASRLVRAYNRPCAVVGLDGDSGTGRGSCRGVPGLDIMRVLDICADSLDGFGGHKAAAGFALRAERFGEFKNLFNEACRECMRGLDLRRVQTIDGWLDVEAADMGLFDELAELEPFGNGNPVPVWGARGVAVADSPRVVGNGHVKFSIARGGPPLPAIWFGAGGKMPPAGRFDVAFELRDNTYRGRRSVQAQIRAIRPA